MGKKLLFLAAVFAATVLLMAVQKPVFLAWYAAGQGFAAADWWQVVRHGLSLDMTVAGYVTALPVLLVLLSLWVRLPQRPVRGVLTGYFIAVSIVAAAIFAVDLALYEHWGFRIDGTILIYLADPREAMASVDFWLGVRQTLLFALYAAAMSWVYSRAVRLFDGQPLRWQTALPWSAGVLLLAGLDFLAIRGGLGASVANVSKAYFSSEMLLNHAAVNPVFSFLSTLGERSDYAAEYPFYDEAERAQNFEEIRGNRPETQPSEELLRTRRPNVVVVILESFGLTVMDAEAEGRPVMPRMQRLKKEGLWFGNFFANSFRTDRGEVAILSGFPAQTRISIMKLPAKSRNLPSLARSLGREGYRTRFVYGGDLNFTDQASYMYATGWQQLYWQKDFAFDTPPADWGYDDRVMCDWFGEQVIRWSAEEEPFLAGLLTLSSHPPFDVPYAKFEDRMLNASAFADECVGRMIDRWKASPAWDDLLVVLVADHSVAYPPTLAYNEPLRHRIPMIWTGGALAAAPREVAEYASQIDLCATLLGQLGIRHDDFDYSKDIFDPQLPKFAYYTFNDGFGAVDAAGEALYDATTGRTAPGSDPRLERIGRTLLQTTYVDIGRR
ncbi:MAG: LTA synthase family protein [Alistipes sp.]|nr:LTA synthase family protein [Alistipes sp.]MDE7344096.1 LTA synthase family protein [Alistipes sp.]